MRGEFFKFNLLKYFHNGLVRLNNFLSRLAVATDSVTEVKTLLETF